MNIGKVKAVLIAATLIDVSCCGGKKGRKEGRMKEKRRRKELLGTYAIGKDYFPYVISLSLIQRNFNSTCDPDDLNPRVQFEVMIIYLAG